MLRPLFTIAALVAATTAVIAQADPIEQRRNIMKGVGGATRTGTQMSKGEIPFEVEKAREVLRVYGEAAESAHSYFPDSARSGGGTTASPKIWESQADFRARFDAWGRDIKAAAESTGSLDTFRASFGGLTRACGSCHQAYRIQT